MPNRSLGPPGRKACLAAIAAITLAAAFRRFARHDGDYERLEIEGGRVRLRTRRAQSAQALDGNVAWARLVVRDWPGECGLELRYAGRAVPFGLLLTEGGRREWAAELGRRLPVTRT